LNKEYRGRRTTDGCVVTVAGLAGTRPIPLRRRGDLANHSPTGFEWGYAGSGPAQLALAILADATGDGALALSLHQRFKAAVVQRLPHEEWTLTADSVRAFAREARP
jgi:Family of unknown function (DUF6166)